MEPQAPQTTADTADTAAGMAPEALMEAILDLFQKANLPANFAFLGILANVDTGESGCFMPPSPANAAYCLVNLQAAVQARFSPGPNPQLASLLAAMAGQAPNGDAGDLPPPPEEPVGAEPGTVPAPSH